MTRKNILIAAAMSVAVLGGAAATANAMIQHGPMRADTNGDGVVSRSEFFNAAEARFKAQDANGDRQLSGDEMKDRGGRFARLDANNDGKLSFTEQATGTAARFAALDVNGDGKLTPEELGPRGEHGRGPHEGPGMAPPPPGTPPAPGTGPGMGGLGRLDTNGDGKITREEMRAQADARFDRMDTNHDGVIDQAEFQAVRDRVGGGGGGRRGGYGRQGMDDMPPPPPPQLPTPGNN